MNKVNVEAAGWFDAVRHVVRWAAPFVPTAFVALTIVVHLLNPELDWVRYTLSDLALGHFGWVESISMFVFGLCLLGVAFGLRHGLQSNHRMRSASVLLVITAVGFAATAVFRTSNSDIVTPGVVIHRIAVITITVAFPVACFLMVRALRSDARWRDMTGYCAAAAVISVVLDLVAVMVTPDVQQRLAGLWEKASVANALVWCQVFASRLFLAGRVNSRASGAGNPVMPGSGRDWTAG
jgi:hypothetical membrane protein